MKSITTAPFLAVLASALLGGVQSHAATLATPYGMLVTIAENPGQFNSTLSGTSVQTFDNLLGVRNNVVWDGVGTFDHLNVIRANAYGGAPSATSPNGSAYAVEGLGSVTKTTLKLDHSSSFFGLFWSAGDAKNDLKFYDKGDLVANFTTANLMSLLPRSYYGNPITTGPNAGKNSGEPYAFINFLGAENTAWDEIVFSNNGSSGFEADNYTTRVEGWHPGTDGTLPGKAVISLETKNGVQTVSKVTSATTVGNKLSLNLVNSKTGLSSLLEFAPSAPGAPAPPLPAVVAFVSVIALKGFRRKKAAA